MPLVLVHNEVVQNPAHQWDDVEGVRYHYPAKYQRLIATGEPFVYYRGTRRANGTRGAAEYVGTGRIGEVWVDPSRPSGRSRALYCSIEDYVRFPAPVGAQQEAGPIEAIARNLWRDGVRRLDAAAYDKILELAGASVGVSFAAPEVASVGWTESDRLLVPAPPRTPNTVRHTPSRRGRSKQSKEVGDWAEAVVLRYIETAFPGIRECTHRAANGETPGWDIDFLDAGGALHRVEVKGTVAAAFPGFMLTAGELRAARTHRAGYSIYFVANCLTDRPLIQAVQDPVRLLDGGGWQAEP